MDAKSLESNFLSIVGPLVFRLTWWTHLDPGKRDAFAEELFDVINVTIVKLFEKEKQQKMPDGAAQIIRPVVRRLVDSKIGDFASHIPAFTDVTYETVVQRILARRNESSFHLLFASQYDLFTSRIANLSDDLISAVKLINEEFIIWLKTHPHHSQQIHADAFEQVTGEILTSHGYEIQFTGRIKNFSADLLAIQKLVDGVLVKYLVECKRYDEAHKVGIAILNALIGASVRAKTSHAMLVTTSSFTSGVLAAHAKLEDFRLDLHDGAQVTNWLADYKFKDFGLWLPDGWRDEWNQ